MAKKTESPFSPATFTFLRQLERNNRRDWFDPRKARYEDEVREPALVFIQIMERSIKGISPNFVVAAKQSGGSLMRPYRDVRFSKDKRPYKTNVGIQFRHVAGKDVHAPGLYVHIEPGGCFLGAGMWRPDAPALKAIRMRMDEDPAGWKKASRGVAFRRVWDAAGDSLSRPPRGFSADHPLIDDLKRKDHIAVHPLDDSEVIVDGFPDQTAATFKKATPYISWLAAAVGLPL